MRAFILMVLISTTPLFVKSQNSSSGNISVNLDYGESCEMDYILFIAMQKELDISVKGVGQSCIRVESVDSGRFHEDLVVFMDLPFIHLDGRVEQLKMNFGASFLHGGSSGNGYTIEEDPRGRQYWIENNSGNYEIYLELYWDDYLNDYSKIWVRVSKCPYGNCNLRIEGWFQFTNDNCISLLRVNTEHYHEE